MTRQQIENFLHADPCVAEFAIHELPAIAKVNIAVRIYTMYDVDVVRTYLAAELVKHLPVGVVCSVRAAATSGGPYR